MQLPRGSFQELKKNIRMSDLLEEIKGKLFTGSCSFTIDSAAGTLVAKDGRVLLASFGKTTGNVALREIFSHSEDITDAEFSLLSPPQLQLALEFNHNARVTETPGVARRVRSTAAPAGSAGETGVRPVPAGVSPQPPAGKLPPGAPSAAGGPATIPDTALHAVTETGADAITAECTTSPEEEPAMFGADLEVLDSMDLETMGRKIRENCENTIRKLHLDYLLTK